MQTWAKRGLQTALVTGGLLMLGTGIAAADENVNPDTPASPLDLNVTVPIQADNNAIGTPLGQVDVPGYDGEISTSPATGAVNDAAAQAKSAAPSLPKADQARQLGATSDLLKHNKISGDLVVPIQIVDNAIGVLGDANIAGGDHTQTYSHNQDVATSGEGSSLAGNAVVLDWALPVQIAGNGGGLAGGTGRVTGGSASQSTTETGNVDTNGDGSAISGNVVAGQFATPVQVTGNAASWILGNGQSHGYTSSTDATSGGSLFSSGDGSSGSGNVVGAPIALPVKFNCNSGAVWGSLSNSDGCNTTADAKAGDTRTGSLNIPTYLETSGDDSFLSGNGGAVSLSPIANVAGVAGSWIGNASAGIPEAGSSSSTVDSGGFVKTAGDNASGSGNVLNPSVALPVEVFGVGGTYIGQANAAHDNTTDANAGNGSYTKGNDSVLGGNIVNTQTAGAPEVFGIGGSHIGNASGTATETKTVTAGAYDGTQGSDSSGSGNVVQVPVGLPAEVFGVGGSFIGQGSGSATETKDVQGGGGGSTHDDNGFLSSNLGTVPASLPVQVTNIGGAFVGQGHSKGSSDTTSVAGGDVTANGPKGGAAGNIIEAPVSLPLQAAGIGGAVAGIGTGENDNITDSQAGGNALTDGQDGAIAGNIVKAPVAGAGTLFGDGIAGGALGFGKGTNDVVSTAGGDATTNGDRGAIAGDIVGVDPLPVAQAFGDAVSVLGVSGGDGVNTTSVTNAGDDTTSGVDGAVSGDILDLPVTAIVQLFGDAVAAGGVANAVGDNTLTTENGGVPVTEGDGSGLSGYNFYHDFVIPVQIFGVPLELIGAATAEATDMTSINGDDSTIAFPVEGSELGATELPSLGGGLPTTLPSLPVGANMLPTPAAFAPRADVPQTGGSPLSGLTALTQVTQLGHLPAAGLPALPGLPGQSTQRADVAPAPLPTPALPTPALPTTGGLPALSGLSALPALPGLPGQSTQRADVPGTPVALPQLPAVTSLSTLPVAGGLSDMPVAPALSGVKGLPALPTAGNLSSLPAVGSLPAVPAVGALPALPTAAPTTLPATPAAPAALPTTLPVKAKLPVLETLPTAQVPALSGMDSAPLSLFQKLLGMAKGTK